MGKPFRWSLFVVLTAALLHLAAPAYSDPHVSDDAAASSPSASAATSAASHAKGGGGWEGRAVVEKLLDEVEHRETLDDLVNQFHRYVSIFDERIGDELGESRINSLAERMFADPLGQVDEARQFTEPLFAAPDHDELHNVPAMIATMADAADAPLGEIDSRSLDLPSVPGEGSDVETWLDYIEALLGEAAAQREQAFAALEAEQIDLLHRRAEGLFAVLQRTVYLENLLPRAPHIYEEMLDWIRLANEVDFEALFRGGAIVAHLADPVLLDHMRADLAQAPIDEELELDGVTGGLIAVRETETLGRFVVGGPQGNTYTGDVGSVIVDVGGNNAYMGDAIAATGRYDAAEQATDDEDDDTADAAREAHEPGISVVLDLAGSNTFSAPSHTYNPRLGGAVGGYALLCSRSGDNTYLGGPISMGVGCFGVGMLVDFEGDNRYTSQSFSLGVGAFGLGLFYDGDGENRVTGTTHSAGLGLPGGTGVFFLGGDGGDEVSISGRHADPPIGSTYGTDGAYQGMCLGAGLGLRSIPGRGNPDVAGGGVGIALSQGGNDRFEAGEFGMGIGYFFGVGIFHNLSGNDRYRAGRYGIATGAHQAHGVFLDDEGDDDYRVSSVAALSGSWDVMVTSFVDGAGNDTYRIDRGHGLGAATITSFSLFYDGGGRDSYSASGRNAIGHGGHRSDAERGTKSLGIFIDLGGEEDTYNRRGDDSTRTDGQTNVQPSTHEDTVSGYGIFHDDGPQDDDDD